MKLHLNKSSLVIVGNQHNPTLFSESFLKKSGIIESEQEIDRKNLIITPAISQVYLSDGSIISVETHKLSIQHNDSLNKRVCDIAQKYCASLPHIKGEAVGINFEGTLDEGFDIDKWFDNFIISDYMNTAIMGVDYVFDINKELGYICKARVFKDDENLPKARLNYHHPLDNKTLDEVQNLNLLDMWDHYIEYSKEFVNSIVA